MIKRGIIIFALVAIIAVPFLLRPKQPARRNADETLVIITPHNEAIRREFGAAFERWYHEKTGRTVAVDWRYIGGTSEILRYLDGEYSNAFENHWTGDLHRSWSNEVAAAFQNAGVKPGATAEADTPAEAARRAYLGSTVGCGIDLFFGGGTYDFIHEAQAGNLVDGGVLQRHPETFRDEVIPHFFAGEEFWDGEGRWFGAVLSNYGIIVNRDSVRRLGLTTEIRQWADLRDPRLLGEVALADPTKSSSMATAFENIIQQHMQQRLLALRAENPGADPKATEAQAVREGWLEGLRLVQLIGANARYFTDSSQKPPIDVAAGNCAAGLCIDFYGRQQEEAVHRRDGSDRLFFASPAGGTVSSVDPMALLRGAKNRAVALVFMDWVLSLEAQKLWDFKPGVPGGPVQFALRRMPVRRDFYTHEEWQSLRSDPGVSPFADGDTLIYQPAWTADLFHELAFVIRVMCQDTHPELVAAWRDIIAAGNAPEAMAALQDLSAIDYEQAGGAIKAALNSKNKVDELTLAEKLAGHFRDQYRRAGELARAARHP
jgi:iron(III) transport system substrate-binding protein